MGQQVQTVKMPAEMRLALQRQAYEEGRTVSEIIKAAVEAYLSEHAK